MSISGGCATSSTARGRRSICRRFHRRRHPSSGIGRPDSPDPIGPRRPQPAAAAATPGEPGSDPRLQPAARSAGARGGAAARCRGAAGRAWCWPPAAPRRRSNAPCSTTSSLLRPMLCWLYPLRVRKTKIRTLTTDECGHFRGIIWRSCNNADKPDLYFTARQRLFPGFWITIYEPTPVGCHTLLELRVRHRGHAGHHASVRARVPAMPARSSRPTTGCCSWPSATPRCGAFMAPTPPPRSVRPVTIANRRPGGRRSPWGGTLRPRLEFDSSLRADLGVMHYRVSVQAAHRARHRVAAQHRGRQSPLHQARWPAI